MLTLIRLCWGNVARLFCARRSLLLENLALRQQLVVFKRRRPRPMLNILDKLFWVTAHRIWSEWRNSLIAVTPETVVRGLPFLLEADLQGSKASWQNENLETGSRLNFSHGGRELDLGSAAHPRRVAHAGFRCLGENHLPLDPQGAKRS
jgi:hypothetical protein